jgi:hypothetical protein
MDCLRTASPPRIVYGEFRRTIVLQSDDGRDLQLGLRDAPFMPFRDISGGGHLAKTTSRLRLPYVAVERLCASPNRASQVGKREAIPASNGIGELLRKTRPYGANHAGVVVTAVPRRNECV